MKRPTLWFGIGCFIILVTSFLQADFSLFPGFLVTFFAVVLIISQWYRKTRAMKNQLAEEQTVRLAAEHYINTRLKPNTSRKRRWF